MRIVYPVKYYSQAGFVERKIEINEEDLPEIIEEYLRQHLPQDFDEVTIVNNRPVNIWLYALCRTYVDPDHPDRHHALRDAELDITGDYDGNPT